MADHPPNHPVYSRQFTVPSAALDQNGHVNNVTYLQWMQDIAVEHYDVMGGTARTLVLGATWVVREHKIVYLRPAFAGDEIEVQTWVVNLRRVRSLRKYQFVRKPGGDLLVRGETDWVFVDAKTGQPRRIPDEIASLFQLVE